MNTIMTAGRLLLVLVLASASLMAQNSVSDEIQRADKQYDLYAYNLALRTYEQVLRNDPRNPHALARVADCYFQLNKPESALEWYERAAQLYDAKPEIMKRYGVALMHTGDYAGARKWFKLYSESTPEEGNHYAAMCDYAIQTSKKEPLYTAKNEPLNTENADYCATMLSNRVIYSSARTDIARKTPNKGGKDYSGSAYNQLFVTQRSPENGYLQKPGFLRSDLQNNYNEGPVTFSGDGKRVAFCRNNFIDGTRQVADKGLNMSIYYADVEENGNWVNVRPFIYNGDYAMGFPSLSFDGNTLVFASNQPGSLGGWDIYVSNWTKGGWSTPRNLGSPLNTPGNEVTPYFDGSNLYFSSDWHNGLGGLDVFRADLGKEVVTDIYHLGPGINSPRDDYGFVYDGTKNIGYLTSNRSGGRGNEDIWQVIKKQVEVVANGTKTNQGPVENNVETINGNAGEGSLYLLVTDINDRAMPDAIVDFSDCGVGVGRTDANGKYYFNEFYRPFNCKVLVSKEGYKEENVELTAFGKQSLSISLNKERREEFFGRVIDAYTKVALPNVTVYVPMSNGNTAQTVTDFEGDYSIWMEPGVSYTLSYSLEGYIDEIIKTKVEDSRAGNSLATVSMEAYKKGNKPPTSTKNDEIAEYNKAKDRIKVITPVEKQDPPQKKPAPEEIDLTFNGYSVQLAASPDGISDTKLRQYESLTKLGNLYLKDDKGVTKVRLGIYPDKKGAQDALKTATKGGKFKDAFVTEEYGADQSLVMDNPTPEKKDDMAEYGKVEEKKPNKETGNTKTPPPAILFAVQIGSYANNKAVNISEFGGAEEIGNLYSKSENEMTKVRVGIWPTHAEAEKAQDELVKIGFQDAIVITEKSEDESIRDLMLIRSKGKPRQEEKQSPTEYNLDKNKSKTKGKSEEPVENSVKTTPKPSSPYKVRLATLNNPDLFDADAVADLGGTLEKQKTESGMTVLLLGGFADMKEATSAMNNARENGFSECYLVKDEKGALKRIN